MNDKTSGRRGARRAGALAVVAAITALTTACGVVHVHFGSGSSADLASTGSATFQEDLAYAHCMQARGLPGFPDPDPSGSSGFSGRMSFSPGSPAARANAACKHLLSAGGTASATASP